MGIILPMGDLHPKPTLCGLVWCPYDPNTTGCYSLLHYRLRRAPPVDIDGIVNPYLVHSCLATTSSLVL